MSSLADTANPYNNEHYHVLKSLVTTKAIILVTDIPSSSKLLLAIFSTIFDILSRPAQAVSKNIEYQMAGLLECLVEETDQLPSQAIEILLAQFLRASTK